MIILEDDILFKVGVKSTFNFVKHFFRKGFWAWWTMDKQQTQKTHLHKQAKTTKTNNSQKS
jgi:hypothetical protein